MMTEERAVGTLDTDEPRLAAVQVAAVAAQGANRGDGG